MLPRWRYWARCSGHKEKEHLFLKKQGIQQKKQWEYQVDVNASPKITTDSCAAVLEKK